MNYHFKELASFIEHSKLQNVFPNAIINNISYDSRNIINNDTTIFIALKSDKDNGHQYIKDLVSKGCYNFIVEQEFNLSQFPKCNFIVVKKTIIALQQFAIAHKNKFKLKIIGITGSNGKTIVKEWLSQLLNKNFNIIKTPQSFNSQIGVPISILNIEKQHNLGIFEAGISHPHEMETLEKIIQPDIGILTNIGSAHNENFINLKQKIEEKLKLFQDSKILFCFSTDIEQVQIPSPIELYTIGNNVKNIFYIQQQVKKTTHTQLTIKFNTLSHKFIIPFIDEASINNTILCICVMLYLKVEDIQTEINQLNNIPMRLEISKGTNNCLLINDSYSNDFTSCKIAIEFIKNRNDFKKKTIFISDLSSRKSKNEYHEIINMINNLEPFKIICVGTELLKYKALFSAKIKFQYYFINKVDCIHELKNIIFQDELILFKGGRRFKFEDIVYSFKLNIHETILEINLNNLIHNYLWFIKKIAKNTKVMAVVKAFGYGTGSVEISKILQKIKVDYLAVAYVNEAIELRTNAIEVPIMVMNTNKKNFPYLIQYNLEPEIYSFDILNDLISYLQQNNIKNFPIHIKIDTGMHRLGFTEKDITPLIKILHHNKNYFSIKSVFSHLVGSDNKKHDTFSQKQYHKFLSITQTIEQQLKYKILKHISNTGGIIHHANMNLDMVRLGIGLYGITNEASCKLNLKPVLTLKTSIAQIKHLNKNDTVGYERNGKIIKPTKIATIRIGYAEGYPRCLGNGQATVLINGILAPTIGNICMDMMMIDISKIKNISVGDTAIMFGEKPTIELVAKQAGTIPYEIMTGISQRVRREYILE